MSASSDANYRYVNGRLVYVPGGISASSSSGTSSSGVLSVSGTLPVQGEKGYSKRALEVIPGEIDDGVGNAKRAKFLVEGDKGIGGNCLQVINDVDSEGNDVPLTAQLVDVPLKVTNEVDSESAAIPLKTIVTSIPGILVSNQQDEEDAPIPLVVKGAQGTFEDAVKVVIDGTTITNVRGTFGSYSDTVKVMQGETTVTIDGNPVVQPAKFVVTGHRGEFGDSMRVINDVFTDGSAKVPLEIRGQQGEDSKALQITNDKDDQDAIQPLIVKGPEGISGILATRGSFGSSSIANAVTNDLELGTGNPIPLHVQGTVNVSQPLEITNEKDGNDDIIPVTIKGPVWTSGGLPVEPGTDPIQVRGGYGSQTNAIRVTNDQTSEAVDIPLKVHLQSSVVPMNTVSVNQWSAPEQVIVKGDKGVINQGLMITNEIDGDNDKVSLQITGADGSDGQHLLVTNSGANPVTVKHQAGGTEAFPVKNDGTNNLNVHLKASDVSLNATLSSGVTVSDWTHNAAILTRGAKGTTGDSISVVNELDGQNAPLPIVVEGTSGTTKALPITNGDNPILITSDTNDPIHMQGSEGNAQTAIRIINDHVDGDTGTPNPLHTIGKVQGQTGFDSDALKVIPGRVDDGGGNATDPVFRIAPVDGHDNRGMRVYTDNTEFLTVKGHGTDNAFPIENDTDSKIYVRGHLGTQSDSIRITNKNDDESYDVIRVDGTKGSNNGFNVRTEGSEYVTIRGDKGSNDSINVTTGGSDALVTIGNKGTNSDAINVRCGTGDSVFIRNAPSTKLEVTRPFLYYPFSYPETSNPQPPTNTCGRLGYGVNPSWQFTMWKYDTNNVASPKYLTDILYDIKGSAVTNGRIYVISSTTAPATSGLDGSPISTANFTWVGTAGNNLIYSESVTMETLTHRTFPTPYVIPPNDRYVIIYYGTLVQVANIDATYTRDQSIMGFKLAY